MTKENTTFHSSFLSEGYQSVLSKETERLALIKRYIDCKRSYEACLTLRDLDNDYYPGAFTGHLAQFGHAYEEDHIKFLRGLEEKINSLGGWEL